MNERQRRVPGPPHPRERREPLPESRPKRGEEDPDAPRRLEAILESPSYRQADQDLEFLHRNDTRDVRLALDYLKPELLLRAHGVTQTVVVFGGTRLLEPAAARRRAMRLRHALAANPADEELSRRAAIAERVLARSRYYDVAREFGSLVGRSPRGRNGEQIVVMTGGGPGVMEAANRGAYDAGAESVGLNITLPHEQYPNPYITPQLCFRFHYFGMRKMHFLLRAKALVAFPGGYGTFDELFEVLTLVQTRKVAPVPVVLVGEQYWRKAVDFDFMVDEGMIDAEDRDLFWFAETAQEVWEGILRWHRENGEPLACDR
ncbi:MAG: TIGR00730 family Rossman fold protein [bacterium]|nr:TIGR00730 family Rossman fold protein [bacterium]